MSKAKKTKTAVKVKDGGITSLDSLNVEVIEVGIITTSWQSKTIDVFKQQKGMLQTHPVTVLINDQKYSIVGYFSTAFHNGQNKMYCHVFFDLRNPPSSVNEINQEIVNRLSPLICQKYLDTMPVAFTYHLAND